VKCEFFHGFDDRNNKILIKKIYFPQENRILKTFSSEK